MPAHVHDYSQRDKGIFEGEISFIIMVFPGPGVGMGLNRCKANIFLNKWINKWLFIYLYIYKYILFIYIILFIEV